MPKPGLAEWVFFPRIQTATAKSSIPPPPRWRPGHFREMTWFPPTPSKAWVGPAPELARPQTELGANTGSWPRSRRQCRPLAGTGGRIGTGGRLPAVWRVYAATPPCVPEGSGCHWQRPSNLLAQDSSSGDSLRLSSSSSPDLLSLVCTHTLFWNVRWLLHRSRVLPFCKVVPS